jgi:hypothetical protein
VSPELYWYRAGKFLHLPSALEADELVFRPPPEFIDALSRLPEAPGKRTLQ